MSRKLPTIEEGEAAARAADKPWLRPFSRERYKREYLREANADLRAYIEAKLFDA